MAENSVRSLYVFACHCYTNKRTTDGNVSSRAQSEFAVETGENTKFAVGSSLISFAVGNSQQRVVACRHFVALVSLFQGRVASCRNLPLTGPFENAALDNTACMQSFFQVSPACREADSWENCCDNQIVQRSPNVTIQQLQEFFLFKSGTLRN